MTDADREFYEEYLTGLPEYRRKVILDVGATAYWCKQWFTANDVLFTGRDVISLTQMVLDRQWEIENSGKITRFKEED